MSEKKNKLGLLTNKLLELENNIEKHKQQIEAAGKNIEKREAQMRNAVSQFLTETIEGISKEVQMIDTIILNPGVEKLSEQVKEHTDKIK